jgi:glutamate dehydrogenase
MRAAIGEFRDHHPALPEAAIAETVAFLEWVEADNFVFLGTRDFSYAGLDSAGIESAQGEGLGLLRDPSVRVLRRGEELVTVTPEVRAFLTAPEPLIVTKANVKSRVHRRDYMDYIGLKRFNDGAVSGELRVVGLFTSEAFTRSTRGIPLIGPKVERIMARAGFDPDSHSGKALLNILEHY